MLFVPNPLTIIDVPADAFHYGTNRIAYDFIVLHDTEGFDSLPYLTTTSPANKRVSCHRYIARGPTSSFPRLYDGLIVKVVPDHLVAYTQGHGSLGGYPDNERSTANLNRVSLSIEIERKYPQLHTMNQLRSTALQCVEWIGLYDNPAILYHWQLDANKDDPIAFPRQQFMSILINELAKYTNKEPDE